MPKPIMAICDHEITYTNKLLELFRLREELPFELHGFTQPKVCEDFCRENKVSLMIISEADYRPEQKLLTDCMMILQESSTAPEDGMIYVRKFQSSKALFQQIMAAYCEFGEAVEPLHSNQTRARMLGLYSPVKRTMQTRLALTMGQLIAAKEKTLYLNLEAFSGFQAFVPDAQGTLTELLYYFSCAKEKMPYRMESLLLKKGQLDLIPPGENFLDFLHVTGEEWCSFLSEIAQSCGYQTIILDISEQMQGLLEVLSSCDHIYTITKDDTMAKCKMTQYESILQKSGQEAILQKTRKCCIPMMREQMIQIEEMGSGELAAYAGKVLKEDGIL